MVTHSDLSVTVSVCECAWRTSGFLHLLTLHPVPTPPLFCTNLFKCVLQVVIGAAESSEDVGTCVRKDCCQGKPETQITSHRQERISCGPCREPGRGRGWLSGSIFLFNTANCSFAKTQPALRMPELKMT